MHRRADANVRCITIDTAKRVYDILRDLGRFVNWHSQRVVMLANVHVVLVILM